jgi:hypothetical protein
LDIASKQYKGWRLTFSATYKAYNNYDERMKKKPDDLDIIEWHYLALYFRTEKVSGLRAFTLLFQIHVQNNDFVTALVMKFSPDTFLQNVSQKNSETVSNKKPST